jgi:hypothetical protein
MLIPGLYEQIISRQLRNELTTATGLIQDIEPIDDAEASYLLARYISEIVEKGLDNLKDSGGDISDQISLTNKIISIIE